MSISSFIQAKSQGAPLWALPIFLKRGLAQRSLFCSCDSPLLSADQLRGKRVGVVSYSSSMAVWMRKVLDDEYRISPSDLIWFTLSSSPQRTQPKTNLLQISKDFLGEEKIQAWEELDGYSHNLDRRELFLFSLLERGELDGVISFQTRIDSNKIRPILPSEDEFWSHYRKTAVYPINHLFVIQEDILGEFPEIGGVLLSAFRQARKLWEDYLPQEKRGAMEKELETLGWDPFAYHLGEVEGRTLQNFIDYLFKEKMISQTVSLDKLFHENCRAS